MKKLLLSLGTLAAVIAPVASVIACGTTTDDGAKPGEGGSGPEVNGNNPEAGEATRIAISQATAEDIAKHLTYQNRQMKFFYVITGKTGPSSFDVLETHDWNGVVVKYTNKLVKTQEEAGAHDMVLNPDFDISLLKPGVVIGQEDIKGQKYVTSKTTVEGIHKYYIINDVRLDQNFVASEEAISTGVVETVPTKDASTLDESLAVDLHKIDLGKAVSSAMTNTLLSRDKITVIKAAWDIFEDRVHTVKDFIELTGTLAYPGNPSATIREHIKQWVERVLAGAQKPTDENGNVIEPDITKGVLEGYDFDVVTGPDILGTLISKHKLDGIKDGWAELTKMTDKDQLISKLGELSYGENLNTQEIGHIEKWVDKVLKTAPVGTPAAVTA